MLILTEKSTINLSFLWIWFKVFCFCIFVFNIYINIGIIVIFIIIFMFIFIIILITFCVIRCKIMHWKFANKDFIENIWHIKNFECFIKSIYYYSNFKIIIKRFFGFVLKKGCTVSYLCIAFSKLDLILGKIHGSTKNSIY